MKFPHTTLALVLGLVATAQAKKLTVVTTLPDYASIVKSIGGDRVAVSSIITGARDPHRLEAKPSYMSRLASADLFVTNGLDLEIGYERPILEGSRNPKVQPGARGYVRVGDLVPVIDKPQGAVSRAQGDIHPYGNPHVWLDPYNGRIAAARLTEKMAGLDPANREFYRANLERFEHALDAGMFGVALVEKFGGDALWKWETGDKLASTLRENDAEAQLGGWAAKMRPLAGREIVTYHRSWNYFTKRFGLRVVAELEPKPGIDPTPGHMASVIRIVQQRNVSVILQEPFYSSRSAEFVAARTGVKVAVVPGSVGHVAAAADYVRLFDVIVSHIAAAAR